MPKRPNEARNEASKIPKLSAFGFSAANSLSKECDPQPLDDMSTTEKSSKSPSTRKFMESWKFGRPWLRFDARLRLMFCQLCIQAQVINSFTTGCDVLKKESVTKHETRKGDNSHSHAKCIVDQVKNMDAAKTTALSKSKYAVMSALRNAWFAATHNLANAIVPDLHKLCIDQGATQLKDLQVDQHTSYTHHSSTRDFQQALADVITDRLGNEARASNSYSIMLDESTDVSVAQNLVVYIRFLVNFQGRAEAVTKFLGIRKLSVANADSIFVQVISLLESFGLGLDKLVGISTDGAAVMVGKNSGVVARLREVTSGLLATHCVAHRLALGTSGAADRVRYLVKFQEILNGLYKYFSQSPKNMSRLEAIQSVLQVSSLRLKQVCNTRWLSFEGSVEAVVNNYGALVSVFLEENTGKALALYKPITTYKFLYTAHFLSDVLKHLCLLCKAYQKSDLNFSDVNPLLSSTVSVLEKLKSASGTNITKFPSEIPPSPIIDEKGLFTFQFHGHTIRDGISQRSEAMTACRDFVDSTINNLKARFTDEGDAKTLRLLTSFFEPSSYSLPEFVSQVALDLSCFLETCGLGRASCIKNELDSFVAYVRVQLGSKSAGLSSVSDLAQLAIRVHAMFPTAAAAAERLLVAPVSTVDCEEGFSKMNIIKTDLRNSLSVEYLEMLMRISMCDEEEFDFNTAFEKWSGKKARRILSL